MGRPTKEKTEARKIGESYNQLFAKKRDHYVPAAGGVRYAARNYNSNDWRTIRGNKEQYQGIYVFAPVDPYSQTLRMEFRSAMSNPYVFRASRIHTSFVCGRGYTTSIVPRQEEELPQEQELAWATTEIIKVPAWNRDATPEEIKDFVDRLGKKLKLAWNVYNAQMIAIEQGRCVLAVTPLERKDEKWQMPEQIRLIRTEHTMRPLLNDNTGDLEAVYAVGIRSSERKQNTIPKERMIYIMHGFNNELYSDNYGDSKVARISDIANSLNVILNQDYPNASKNTWHKPGAWVIPIPPQEFGNEDTIVTAVANKINESEGKTVVMSGPSNKDDLPPQFIPGDKYADIAGLDVMRMGLIKALITAFGTPAFLLSEGDIGPLGGNSYIEQIDDYLNTEIATDRHQLEETIENQFYDRILCILFNVDEPDKLPIKMKHHFNKPKLFTLLPPELYQQLLDMEARGLIDETGLRDFLGITEYDNQQMTTGANYNPGENTQWPSSVKSPIQINVWPGKDGSLSSTTSAWGTMPARPPGDNGAMPSGWGKEETKDGGEWGDLSKAKDKLNQKSYQWGRPSKDDLKTSKGRYQWAKLKTAKEIAKNE